MIKVPYEFELALRSIKPIGRVIQFCDSNRTFSSKVDPQIIADGTVFCRRKRLLKPLGLCIALAHFSLFNFQTYISAQDLLL